MELRHQTTPLQVSPGLKAGSGLKHLYPHRLAQAQKVSPGLKAGSGLKHAVCASQDDGAVYLPALKPGVD